MEKLLIRIMEKGGIKERIFMSETRRAGKWSRGTTGGRVQGSGGRNYLGVEISTQR